MVVLIFICPICHLIEEKNQMYGQLLKILQQEFRFIILIVELIVAKYYLEKKFMLKL